MHFKYVKGLNSIGFVVLQSFGLLDRLASLLGHVLGVLDVLSFALQLQLFFSHLLLVKLETVRALAACTYYIE